MIEGEVYFNFLVFDFIVVSLLSFCLLNCDLILSFLSKGFCVWFIVVKFYLLFCEILLNWIFSLFFGWCKFINF